MTIWYVDSRQGWRDCSVQLHEGHNGPGCARYLQITGLSALAGSCYELADIPMGGTIQVRVHYASGLIRDYYADPTQREPFFWGGVTRED